MYAKLFSRITESSLMEEKIPTRYTFVMLLAIADPHGYVIGTDVAIARRLNMPLEEFQAAVERLSAPDGDSNSKEQEGRRLVPSDGERGYRIVNYVSYRNTRDEEARRAYMREYMGSYRLQGKDRSRRSTLVNSGKHGKPQLAQAEAEAEAEAEKDVGPNRSPSRSAVASPTSRNPVSVEWLAELRADPAFHGIDVDREHAKMLRWCTVNKKQPTKRRFVNWLNRCDTPLPATAAAPIALASKWKTGEIDPTKL